MRAPSIVAVIAVAVTAVACGPPSALQVSPGARPILARVDSVFVDAAIVRTAGEIRSLRTEIEAWLKKRVRPIAPLRDEADAILVFEAADRLDCGGCEDPAIRWHWWGFVFAADGRELASLHGELPVGREPSAKPFVDGLETVSRGAR